MSLGHPRAPDRATRRAVLSTYSSFIANGAAFSSWASRIPQVRDQHALDPSTLGLVLLAIAAGSLVSMPLAGPTVARWGSRRTVTVLAVLDGLALVGVAFTNLEGVAPLVVALFVFGFAQGGWDVAMNVQGTVVERSLGRAIMPRFHAGWSVGTVAAALLGAVLVGQGVTVTVHLVCAGALLVVVVPLTVRPFLDDAAPPRPRSPRRDQLRDFLAAWREPRTLLVGLVVLAFAFGEGVGNDWTSVAFIDGYGISSSVATVGFAVFLASMTVGRWFGPHLLDRFGRVVTVRVLGAVSIVGVAVFVFAGSAPVAFLGSVLWGVGLSLGFPAGMSAGGDEPEHAARRVSVIGTIGYLAFLGGPPFIGFLAAHIGILNALGAVGLCLALALLLVGHMRPPPGQVEHRPGRSAG